MQWADSGSINLLFHLGRELAGTRVLLVCAYRPEEVALGRDGAKHPLEPVLSELKRAYGEIWIDLNQIQGERFVEDFIDSEPNRLGDSFRNQLFEHTSGHALFTVELLRDLQERGDLVTDNEGYWVEGPELDWNRLPTRVEGVIEARIGRLEEELRDILTVAAVEGEDFTAQVVAQVQEIQERKLLHILSRELEKHHKLVLARETFRLNGMLLSRYRFAHTLFQRYLYNDLSPGERTLLHGEIAAVLEELHGGDLDAVAVQLGMHYAAANMGDKAVPFLLKAGDRARSQYAFHEAAKHYETALTFLKSAGLERKAAQTLMKLGLTYQMATAFKRSRLAYDEGFSLWRNLATKEPDQPQSPAPHPYRLSGQGYKTTSARDPAMTRSVSNLLDNIFSGLVECTVDWNVVPDIAHSWTVTGDGTKYVFQLRHDVFWSDGTPITAHDFEYSLKRVLDPATQSPFAEILFDILGAEAYNNGETEDPGRVGIKAAADHSLEIKLRFPVGYFIHILAQNIAKPVPRHKVETLGSDWSEPANLVSNGPFLLEDIPDEAKVILRRNPRYHGLFRGNIERIILYTPVEEWDYYPRYEEETLDMIELDDIPFSSRRMIKQRHIEDYHWEPYFFVGSMELNPLLPPFDRLEIRQAFAHAINKEAFSSKIGPGYFPATGGYIPPGVPGHSPDIGLVYDPTQARRLLEAAGFSRGRGIPPIPIITISSNFIEMMEIIAANWREVLDIDCYVHYDESVDSCSEIPEACAIPRAWVADYPDPDNFLRTALYPIMKLWKNEEYIRLVELARRLTDQNKRVQLYRKADRILVHDAVVIPVVYQRQERLVKPWVRNKVFEPWMDLIIDPH
jgi:ABC-type oligopeptide transport system substrate-binding subunit